MVERIRRLWDAHLTVSEEKLGARMVKMLEVRKIRNAELHTGNTVNFEVEPGTGLRVVSGAKVKV